MTSRLPRPAHAKRIRAQDFLVEVGIVSYEWCPWNTRSGSISTEKPCKRYRGLPRSAYTRIKPQNKPLEGEIVPTRICRGVKSGEVGQICLYTRHRHLDTAQSTLFSLLSFFPVHANRPLFDDGKSLLVRHRSNVPGVPDRSLLMNDNYRNRYAQMVLCIKSRTKRSSSSG